MPLSKEAETTLKRLCVGASDEKKWVLLYERTVRAMDIIANRKTSTKDILLRAQSIAAKNGECLNERTIKALNFAASKTRASKGIEATLHILAAKAKATDDEKRVVEDLIEDLKKNEPKKGE